MYTISQAVEEIISQTPFLEEGLVKNLINLSALAREIRPVIEEKLLKDIKEGAIIMALRRISKKNGSKINFKKIFFQMPEMIVRSNLIEFTFANSSSLMVKYRLLLKEIVDHNQFFFTITQGIFETGIIISQELGSKIEQIFKEENILAKLPSLASITIKLPEANVSTPGVYYFILKALAWQNINVVEVISTYHEITLVLDSRDVDKAFSYLKKSLTFH